MINWIAANWSQVLVSVLAIDRTLITLFPNAKLLQSIGNFLGGFGKG